MDKMTGQNAPPQKRPGAGESRLDGLRLLIALDALLVHGSVSRAAEQMGLGTPAMSRILKQIREKFDDPILIRTPKGMVPTPFAETLRPRLRLIAAEAEDLLDPDLRATGPAEILPRPPPLLANIHPPPQSQRSALPIDDMPQPSGIARKLAAIGPGADPRKRLAKFIATTGAGVGQSRPLTLEEADDAFRVILDGEADPIQIGALLIVLHYRGTTATELAGLVQAARRHVDAPAIGTDDPGADIDWPVYLSPKSRAAPWFLLAAKLLSQAGHRVLLHGSGGTLFEDKLSAPMRVLDIPTVSSAQEARAVLGAVGIAHLPLPALSCQLHRLLTLYGLFELRSPINLLVHLLNPLAAPASLFGVVDPIYRPLLRDAAAILGWRQAAVFGNHRDVAQATPYRTATLFRLERASAAELVLPSGTEPKSKRPPVMTSLEYWHAVWLGRERDARASQTVIDTAALALMTVADAAGADFEAYRRQADLLWTSRRTG